MGAVLMRVGLAAAGLTYAAGAWGLTRVGPRLVELGVPEVALPIAGWLWAAAGLLLLLGAALPAQVVMRRVPQPRTSFL